MRLSRSWMYFWRSESGSKSRFKSAIKLLFSSIFPVLYVLRASQFVSYDVKQTQGSHDRCAREGQVVSIRARGTGLKHASKQLVGDLLDNPLRFPFAALAIPVGYRKGGPQDHEAHQLWIAGDKNSLVDSATNDTCE